MTDMQDLADYLAEQKAKLEAILARAPVVADADYEMDVTDDWLDLTGDDQNIAVALFSTEATDEAWLSDAGHGRFTEHPYTAYTATLIGLRVGTTPFTRVWCEHVFKDGVVKKWETDTNDKLNNA